MYTHIFMRPLAHTETARTSCYFLPAEFLGLNTQPALLRTQDKTGEEQPEKKKWRRECA